MKRKKKTKNLLDNPEELVKMFRDAIKKARELEEEEE